MALLKLGPVVAGVSGSIGGTVFARNRAGAYARARTKPIIPVSARRDVVQARLTSLVSWWHDTLTPAQRALWDAKGAASTLLNRLGESYTPTGMNLYIRSNALLHLAGTALVTTPPVNIHAPALAPVLAWTTAVGIQISSIGLFLHTFSGCVIVRHSPLHANGENFWKGPWGEATTFACSTLSSLPKTIVASALLTANSRSFIELQVVGYDGSASAKLIAHVDVGSPA